MPFPYRGRPCGVRDLVIWLRPLALVGFFLAAAGSRLAAQTGTFVDKWAPTDLRMVTYNVNYDSIFPEDDDGPIQAPKFVRVMQALQPDILNLQEIYDHDSSDVVDLMNTILPLGGGATWYGTIAYDNVIVSKYPLTMTASSTIPAASGTSVASALVDLPDNQYATDFFLMNNHFKCCGSNGSPEDIQRQGQADALVNWMRDARTPGGYVNLPEGTPMAVVGDFNLVGSTQPLNTVLSGNIIYESYFGADSPPDWDGTSLTDPHPVHNGSGSTDYTWRAGGTSRLDYMLYTDSVASVANKFVLNTVSMSPAQLAATGLQTYDITFDSYYYDHLPVVVDFRLPSSAIPGDYDHNGYVDEDDFDLWRTQFGTTVEAGTESDGNSNGIVDAGDYSVWRDNLGAGIPPGAGAAAAAVPEPASITLWILFGTFLFFRRQPNKRHRA
jgi:endonuclease/exonuclease/phosphatase family metal-dependent hydrolase